MSVLFPVSSSGTPGDKLQARLLGLAAGFTFFLAIGLSLAPAVRSGSWQTGYRWQHWIGFAVWLVFFAVAHRQSIRLLPERDPYLLPLAGLLTGWGIITIFRLSEGYGLRQTLWLALCMLVLIAGFRLPQVLELFRRYKYFWLTSGLLLTVLTFFFGSYPDSSLSGPRLWLGCCGIYIQPSEPLKLLLIVFLAAYLANNLHIRTNLIELVAPLLAMAGVAMLLLVAQRDLGTATLFIFIFTMVLYVASEHKRVLVISALFAIGAALVGFFNFDVVRLRLDAWLNPWIDPSGRSYQIVQSLLSIANGGILGRGIGLGSPSLVPVAISDFIFAAISEETGLLGSIGLILVEALFLVRCIRLTLRAPNAYQRYLGVGLTAFLVSQSILIIGGNIRLLPLTGVTLPFVSYGGSSLLTAFMALLLLIHISNHPDQEPARLNSTRPYQVFSIVLIAGLAAAGLVSGWWSVVRADDLLQRSDNPRRSIADRYVMRGTLFDRDGEVIQTTQGTVGDLLRISQYPPLSPIIGYTNSTFGQAGLEATLDPTLRGLTNYPLPSIWWSTLLYGHPPPGLDIRLTLDLDSQRRADQLLGDRTGAIVLLNPESGDILALVSHPGFDSNTLETDWESLSADPLSPLLNRTTQGSYQPGSVLGPFVWAIPSGVPLLESDLPEQLDLTSQNGQITCAQTVDMPITWETSLAAGCPAVLKAAAEKIGQTGLLETWTGLGLFSPPDVPLPSNPALQINPTATAAQLGLGQAGMRISPLQLARAAAVFSTNGRLPGLRLVAEIHDPGEGWQEQPALGTPTQVFTADQVGPVLEGLSDADGTFWAYTGLSQADPENPLTWYLTGTFPGQPEPLLAIVVLESLDPMAAQTIGDSLIHP